jgi:hypothetical protein
MPFDIGINFRATAGFVTDGSGEVPRPGEPYPTTKTAGPGQSVTAGWNVGLPANTRDRDAGNDRRLAGINFKAVDAVFQLDLTAPGTYQDYCAAGDTIDGDCSLWDLCDNNTVIQSLTKDNLTARTFDDATDTVYSNSAWPGSNTPQTYAFVSPTFKLKINSAPLSNNCIAHLRIVQVATGAGPPRRKPRLLEFVTPDELEW